MPFPEKISMTPDGAVQWRQYREHHGFFLHDAVMSADEVAQLYDALFTPSAELVSKRGNSAVVSRYGHLALKRYRSSVRREPKLNGRLENLRMNVALTHSLRDQPRIDDTRWRLRGPQYFGAFLADKHKTTTTWAMEYVPGRTLRSMLPFIPLELKTNLLVGYCSAVKAAAEATGIDTHLYIDHHNENYLVPESSIAALNEDDGDLELVRIDVGSKE